MRGWLEPGARANAAARKERDRRGVDVPADRVGEVARFLVLGDEADERALERRVKGGEEQRKRGLGHTRVRRERVDECAEPLARGELLDDPGKRCRCWVHTAGGNGVPRA